MLVNVGLDEARIHRKAFPADKPGRDACPDHRFENAAENIAVAEPPVARASEHRMIGDITLDTEATKPAISEVELDVAAQRAFHKASAPVGGSTDQGEDNSHTL